MSTKRKILGGGLNRRVRARRELSQDLEEASESPSPTVQSEVNSEEGSDSESELGSEQQTSTTDKTKGANDSEDVEDEDEVSGSESESEPEEAASISFGALAKAQASLQRSGKSKLPKGAKPANVDGWEDNEAKERKEGRKDHRDFNRSNKHAPTEMSSKKAVSRRREIIPVIERKARDPRFEPISGTLDNSKVQKAYSFLDDYRDDEIKELKLNIRKAKTVEEKDKLKRTLMSMESKKRAQDRKNKQEEILARHKKEEKELVKQGKQPFYLKDSEKKKRVLLDTYSGLKGGQLDHVIERRRRKLDQKEKKNLPFARRGME